MAPAFDGVGAVGGGEHGAAAGEVGVLELAGGIAVVEALGRQPAAFAAEEGVGAKLAGGLAGGGDVTGDPDLRVAGFGHGDQGGGGADDVNDGAGALGVRFEGSR